MTKQIDSFFESPDALIAHWERPPRFDNPLSATEAFALAAKQLRATLAHWESPEQRDLDKLKRRVDRATGDSSGGDHVAKLIEIINARDSAQAERAKAHLLIDELTQGEDGYAPDEILHAKARQWFNPEEQRALLRAFLIRGADGTMNWRYAQNECLARIPVEATIRQLEEVFIFSGECVPEDYQTGFKWKVAATWYPSHLAQRSKRHRRSKVATAMGLASEWERLVAEQKETRDV